MIMLATEGHEAYPIPSLNVNLLPVSLRQKELREKVCDTEACLEWLTNPLVSFVPGFIRSRKGPCECAYIADTRRGNLKKTWEERDRDRWKERCVFVGVRRCASSGACCEITMTVLFFLHATSDRAHSFFAAESDRLKARHLFLSLSPLSSSSFLSFSPSLSCVWLTQG